MPEPLKIFLGFCIGFGLWEWINLPPGEVDLLGTAADILGPAVIATVVVVLIERWRDRRNEEA